MSTLRALYLVLLAFIVPVIGPAGEIGIYSFLIPSILMGLGVAIDVALATLAKFNDSTLSWKNWTIPVTLTHVAFPAFGYFIFWFAGQTIPALQVLLGLIGFILVALFMYEVLANTTGREPFFGISRALGKMIGCSDTDARLFVAILAVSWDALWSGPAKAAQAAAGDWSWPEVWMSFAVAGLVVAIMAELSLLIAGFLRRYKFKNTLTFAASSLFGTYLELSVIGGFGILSLMTIFNETSSLYEALIVSSLIMGVIFIFFHKSLFANRIKEADTAIHTNN
jgi:hypothetical protein